MDSLLGGTHSLANYQRNYALHDLELATIIHPLQLWRHYLVRKAFELRSNHHGLKYIFTQPKLHGRQRRWSEFLVDYDFEISYIKVKKNRVVDGLSRRRHISNNDKYWT